MDKQIHMGHIVSSDKIGLCLHDSAKKGQKRTLKQIIQRGIFVDYPNDEGQTALFVACCENREAAAKVLLKHGANPNERSNSGMTPIHMTCHAGNTQLLVKLIEAGGDLRLHDYSGRSPKDWAVANEDPKKRLKMLEFLEKSHMFAVTHSGRDLTVAANKNNKGDRIPSIIQMFKQKVGLDSNLHLDPLKKVQSMGFGNVYLKGETQGAIVSVIPVVNENSLFHDSHGVTYENGSFLVMESMSWNTTAVTVKRLHKQAHPGGYVDVLITEMEQLGKIRHPNVLLLMGMCQTSRLDSIVLVFERIGLGSLYYYLHQRVERLPTQNIRDILLQICSALMFLHNQHFIHCNISSHAVNLVTPFSAKLGNFEHMIDSSKADMGKQSAVSQIKYQNTLYNWMAPELMQEHPASFLCDVYSFSSIIWEMFECEIPWDMCDSEMIKHKLTVEKQQLRIGSSRMPPLFKSIAAIGLQLDPYDRVADFDKIYKWLLGHPDEPLSKTGPNSESSTGKSSGRKSGATTTDATPTKKQNLNRSSSRAAPNAPAMEEYSPSDKPRKGGKYYNENHHNQHSPTRRGSSRGHRVKIMEDEFTALESMGNRRQKETSFGKIPFSAGNRDWVCNVQREKDADFYSYAAQVEKDVHSPTKYSAYDKDATLSKQYMQESSSDSSSDDDVTMMKKYLKARDSERYKNNTREEKEITDLYKTDYQRRDPRSSPPRSAPVSPRHFSYLALNQQAGTGQSVVKPASHCTEAGCPKTSGQLTTAGSLFALYNSGTDLNQMAKLSVGSNPYATFPRNTKNTQYFEEEFSRETCHSPDYEESDPQWFGGRGSVKNLVHLYQDQADTHKFQQNVLEGKVSFNDHPSNKSLIQKNDSPSKAFADYIKSNQPSKGLEYKQFVDASSPPMHVEKPVSNYIKRKEDHANRWNPTKEREVESDSQESCCSATSSGKTDQCSSVDSDLLSSWIAEQLKRAKTEVERERAYEYNKFRYEEEEEDNDGGLLDEIMDAMSKPSRNNQYQLSEEREVYGQKKKEEFDLKEYYIDDDISGESDEVSHIKLQGNFGADRQRRDGRSKMRSKSDMKSYGKHSNKIEKRYKRESMIPKPKAIMRPMAMSQRTDPSSKAFTTTLTVESSLVRPGEHHLRHMATDHATGQTKLLHQETVQAATVRSTLEA